MTPIVLITVAMLALATGLAIGWLLGARSRPQAGVELERELRTQLAAKDSALAELAEREKSLLGERERAVADLAAEKRLSTERASSFEDRLRENREAQDRALIDLREAFKALSTDALRQNAPEFLRMAAQTFERLQESAKGDLAQRQEAIVGMLKPLEEQLRQYQQRLAQSETAQVQLLTKVTEGLQGLTQQSEALAGETHEFRLVLTSNQARGRWGEQTLRRVVEAAGMSTHVDFTEQSMGDEGKPDMLVRLPGNRLIIVDSKVPDLDLLAGLEQAGLAQRVEALRTHAQKLRGTITDLSRRNYPAQFENALDYVVLFLPAESLFSAALEGDQELVLWAASKQIMLATPSSLIALLRAVSISWLQHDQTENARDIAETAQELYQRVAVFTGHFEKIRDGLEKASKAYNDACGSFERSVRPSGERLSRLGGGSTTRQIPETGPVETELRSGDLGLR